jgi:hypothetical protein
MENNNPQEKERVLKEGFTYLYMKKKYQRFLGSILLIAGIALILSTFIPEIINSQSIILIQYVTNQYNLIRLILGAIISFIGFMGIKAKW